VGLDRTLKIIDARPDLALTAPVVVKNPDGSTKTLPEGAPAPAPVEGSDASADLVKTVNERTRAA